MYGEGITIREEDVMKEILLGDAFLGFIPNMTEKRKVVEQRKARSLERILNHAKYFRENEEKLQAVYSKKEHVVRLVFTKDYMDSDKEVPLFEVRERSNALTSNQELKKPVIEHVIKGHVVSVTEFEFGQYIFEKFKGEAMSLEEGLASLLQAAQEENRQIEKRVVQKSERLQRENQKRREAEQARRSWAAKKFQEAVDQLETSTTEKTVEKGKEINMEKSTTQESFRKDFKENKTNQAKVLAQEAMAWIKEYRQNPLDVMEYLDFMSKFPELSPRNLALLEKQWPGANMVATYNQWAGKTTEASKNMGKVLKVKPQDIESITRVVTDKKTGETKTILLDQLSVRQGEKSKISLIRGQEERYIEKECAGKIQAHWEKYWSQEEKQKVEAGEIKIKTYTKYVPYKVFEISQTNIKPESLPQLMPNRHVNFEAQPEVLKSMKTGLEIYARSIGVEIVKTKPTDAQTRLGNAKGAATLDGKKIIMNHLNTPSENVTTLIHELAHSTLHKGGSANPMSAQYAKQEFEAEMVSYVVSKRYGIDTREKAIPYMAEWTDNMKQFSGEEGTQALSQSLSRIQKASHAITKRIDAQLDPVLKQMQKRMHQKAKQHGEPKPTLSHQQNSLHIGR